MWNGPQNGDREPFLGNVKAGLRVQIVHETCESLFPYSKFGYGAIKWSSYRCLVNVNQQTSRVCSANSLTFMKSDRDVFDTSWFTRNALLGKVIRLYDKSQTTAQKYRRMSNFSLNKSKKPKRARQHLNIRKIIDNDEIMHCTLS